VFVSRSSARCYWYPSVRASVWASRSARREKPGLSLLFVAGHDDYDSGARLVHYTCNLSRLIGDGQDPSAA